MRLDGAAVPGGGHVGLLWKFLSSCPVFHLWSVDDTLGNTLVDHLIWIRSFHSGGLKRLGNQLRTPEGGPGTRVSGVFCFN